MNNRDILDEDIIKNEEIEIPKVENRDENLFLFISSVIFGFGFLIVLVNGYYHFNYLRFNEIGRKDLIARLGFLSYIVGSLFYPVSIIITGTRRHRV